MILSYLDGSEPKYIFNTCNKFNGHIPQRVSLRQSKDTLYWGCMSRIRVI
nr:MAG TPA: hypothetical protein [Caudoviricetes sp.]